VHRLCRCRESTLAHVDGSVHAAAEVMSRGVFEKILIPVDFSDAAAAALALGRRLAAAGARLTLLHVLAVTPVDVDAEAAARIRAASNQLGILRSDQVAGASPRRFVAPFTAETLERFTPPARAIAETLQAWAKDGPDASALLTVGEPGEQIVEAAVRGAFDLVIVSSPAHGAVHDLVMGGVVARVIRAAPCPVLVVPGDPAGRPN
jgi:nucleotide-binding universal stress UspA family protein